MLKYKLNNVNVLCISLDTKEINVSRAVMVIMVIPFFPGENVKNATVVETSTLLCLGDVIKKQESALDVFIIPLAITVTCVSQVIMVMQRIRLAKVNI